MKDLRLLLEQETQVLKQKYLESIEKYANSYYNTCLKRKSWNEADWCKYFGLTPRPVNVGTSMEFLSYPQNFHNTKDARRLNTMKNDIRRILSQGLEKYLAKEIEKGNIHYNSSLDKLVERLNKKGIINGNKNKITKESIGINIHLTIEHDNRITKAWTIVAEGEIQRPHYRYLIK